MYLVILYYCLVFLKINCMNIYLIKQWFVYKQLLERKRGPQLEWLDCMMFKRPLLISSHPQSVRLRQSWYLRVEFSAVAGINPNQVGDRRVQLFRGHERKCSQSCKKLPLNLVRFKEICLVCSQPCSSDFPERERDVIVLAVSLPCDSSLEVTATHKGVKIAFNSHVSLTLY